jgi:oligopeptide/dipeptide ABC transporter ATP-binding protein
MTSVPETGSPPDRAEALLSVRSLTVEFGTPGRPIRAVDGVSFEVRRGETVALVGESGSGKSTIGLAVMGLLPRGQGRIVDGEVTFRGVGVTNADERTMQRLRGAHMSMVFQDPLSSLNPVLTIGRQVREIFTHHRGMTRAKARAATIELLDRVRMPDAARRYKQYPQQFSGGMRQRVVIAMALALDPELIIADEPTTALDVTVQARIMDLLGELTSERGSGLLLITHDLGVVAGAADRVYVLYAGRVMESGRIRDIYESPANPYTVGLLNSVPTLARVGSALTPIPGSPPDPTARPSGCPFQPRCAFARDRCREESPPLVEVRPGRFSACHYAEEVISGAQPTRESRASASH